MSCFILYVISTEIYSQRWHWWKNPSAFIRSQSATRTMKLHQWKIIIRGVWLDERCFSLVKSDRTATAFLFSRCREGFRTLVQLIFDCRTRKHGHITKRKPNVKLFQTSLGTRNVLRKVDEIPALELKEYLCKFIISVRTKDRNNFEHSSLRSLLASFEWHLRKTATLLVSWMTSYLKKQEKSSCPNRKGNEE